jgi:hypothetical protein
MAQGISSDEWSSVPIRDSILNNIFPEKRGLGDNPDPRKPKSFTESQTEHESLHEDHSLEPPSWNSAARASTTSESQSSLGVDTSYSSLPPEVWEFRKMFENGDESYPADFPESLRS